MSDQGAEIRRIVNGGGGWPGALILVVVAAVGSLVCYLAGGSLGAFGFVTLHFVVLPPTSLLVAILTIMKCRQLQRRSRLRHRCLVALVVPALFCYLAVTGDLFKIMKWLEIPPMSAFNST